MTPLEKRIKELQSSVKNFREFYNEDRVILQHSSIYSVRDTANKREAMSRFTCKFARIPEDLFRMTLDFNPIIRAFDLNPMKQRFILSHWNVGPRVPSVRMGEFGYYCADKGKISYQIIPHEMMLPSVISSVPIQIENTAVLPTAVLLHNNCTLEQEHEFFIIKQH